MSAMPKALTSSVRRESFWGTSIPTSTTLTACQTRMAGMAANTARTRSIIPMGNTEARTPTSRLTIPMPLRHRVLWRRALHGKFAVRRVRPFPCTETGGPALTRGLFFCRGYGRFLECPTSTLSLTATTTTTLPATGALRPNLSRLLTGSACSRT